MERESNTRFVQSRVDKIQSGTSVTFTCHRSGKVNIKSFGRKRKLKLKGSKKLDGVCPARIKLLFNNKDGNSLCRVSFFKTHVGHDITNRKELGYLSLHKEDRYVLASRIASGVPLQRILDDAIANDELILQDYLNPRITRAQLLTNADLHSIEESFNVKPHENSPRPFNNHVDDVDAWIEGQAENILLYKRQHDFNPEFPTLLP